MSWPGLPDWGMQRRVCPVHGNWKIMAPDLPEWETAHAACIARAKARPRYPAKRRG